VATKQCPPQEELEFQLVEGKYPDTPELARPADIISKWLNDHVYESARRALRVTLDSPFGLDVVYAEGEYADPVDREGLLTGAVDPSDNWRALTMTADGKLRVDANISITQDIDVNIDAEDGDSAGMYGYVNGDTDAVIPLNLDAEGKVKVVQSSSASTVVIYDEGLFNNTIEHVVISHTIGVGTSFSLLSIQASGHADAWFRIKVNGNTIAIKRNNWCERNVEFSFSYGLSLTAGDIITVTIKHSQLTSIPFNATIYGEE